MSPDTVTWPDTRRQPPPSDNLYAAAEWLIGRHPTVARLAGRAGVVALDDDGDPSLDLDALAERLTALDADRAAWADYERRRAAPRDDAAYDAWEAAGPPRTPAAAPLAGMSRTEISRLRLLATFSGTRVPFSAADLRGLDESGQQLVQDWCDAVKGV